MEKTTAAPLAPSRSAAPRPPQPWTWRVQALLSAYLPLLLMAFLASGTWWLVKNTPTADGPTEAQPLRHAPDYQMQGFELQRVGANGLLRVRIEGTEMRHYPDTDTVEIDGIRLRALGDDGSVTLATARSAVSNGDGSEVQLLGGVQLQRFQAETSGKNKGEPQATPQLQVSGEFLLALVNKEQMRSHLPVQISYAGGEVHAQSFEYDHLHGQLSFKARTTARFDPPPAAKKR
jgi:lipopolysaccharide export system protein LptC